MTPQKPINSSRHLTYSSFPPTVVYFIRLKLTTTRKEGGKKRRTASFIFLLWDLFFASCLVSLRKTSSHTSKLTPKGAEGEKGN